VLNITRNAAQAMEGDGRISFRTRVARQVTLAMKRWKLAIRLDVIDNGPGIPDDMLGRVFFPLVSGREGGTGLGLTPGTKPGAAPRRRDPCGKPAGAHLFLRSNDLPADSGANKPQRS
jgi:hypothetical protein